MKSQLRIFTLTLCLCWLVTAEAQELEFHFLDVGQGDCSLIICPNGFTVLVDCGRLKNSATVRNRTREYLIDHLPNGPVVDVVVITHPDTDHYRFLPDVLEGIEVGQLLHVGSSNDHPVNDTDEWIRDQNRTTLDVDDIDAPDSPSDFFDSGDVDIHILAANVAASSSVKNAKSIVLRVDFGDFEAILTGDGTFDTEAAIADNYDSKFLDVELLKIGHHGSSTTSTSDEWVKLLRPMAAVVSAGFDNSFEHPRKRVIDRVATKTADTAPEHFMRWGVRQRGGNTRLETISDYTEAIFNSASNGNVLVTTDGSEFKIRYGGEGRLAGEMELTAKPGEALPSTPTFRAFADASLAEGGLTATPALAERLAPVAARSRGTFPSQPPIQVGATVVVDTEARAVKGKYMGVKNGWLVIQEAEGGKTFVQSGTLVIRVVDE